MYKIKFQIEGTAVLLQNRYRPQQAGSVSGRGRRSGEIDYSNEWKEKIYVDSDSQLYQPSECLDAAMQMGAKVFPIPGRGKATYCQLFKAAVFTQPDRLYFDLKLPGELSEDPDQSLYIDRRPVRPQGRKNAVVVRSRPAFKPGWHLGGEIIVRDDQIFPERVHEILTYSGAYVGIGDFRPRFGRFIVSHFEKI